MTMTNEVEKSILFVDTKVDGYKVLIDGVRAGTKVVILNPAKNGVEQITQTLSQYSNIKDVHILSHGNQAELFIGNSSLNQSNLAKYQSALQSWGEALVATANILIYGCNVAKGELGQLFIKQLSLMTGADIAASSNLTGNVTLGGDWILEKEIGVIESSLVFNKKSQDDFYGVLSAPVIETFFAQTTALQTTSVTINGMTYDSSNGVNTTTNLIAEDSTMGGQIANHFVISDNGTTDKQFFFNTSSTGALSRDSANVPYGAVDFRISTADGTEFKMVSMEADTGVHTVTPAWVGAVTFTGYRNGVSIATDTVTFSTTDTAGSISYTKYDLGYGGIERGGSLTFNTDWENIDEIRITGSDVSNYLIMAIDNLVFSTAVVSSDPTIVSATYDASSGALLLTGTNFAATAGATNDVIANKITLTGEGGTTYTLTDTANVEISSATAATLSLSATDKAALNQIFNKDGTTSTGTTTYDVDGAAGFIAASAGIDDTGVNGVTVSNVAAPTITSSTYDANTGVLVLTGTGFLSKTGASNDIVASKFTFTGEGGATYTLTDTADVEVTSGTAATITLSATDKAAINPYVNKDGTVSTSGTTYNISAAEDWAAGADAAVNVVDAFGNAITASNVAVPTLTSSTYDASSGTLVLTGTNFFNKSGATNDIVANKFTFTGEGGTTYTLTDTSNVEITSGTAATIVLSATDKATINQIINNNGTASTSGTTYNINAAEDWAAGADAATNVVDATGNAITVSNVAVPTITASTYDAAAGTLTVTGTGFLNKAASADVVASKFTFTGAGTSYTLTDSSDVEITEGTNFTIALSVTDKAALNQIINKNGTESTDTVAYNLSAAEDWAAGTNAAVNVVDATGNAITASNVATPTITSAAYDYSSNVLSVTGAGFLKKSGASNDIDISKFSFTGEGGASYTLSSTSDVETIDGTSFTITLSGIDLTNVESLLNKDGITANDASVYNLSAAEDWAVGASAAVNVVDATGNGITVSNFAVPTLTSASYDHATGQLVLSGSNFINQAGASNDIVANLLSITGEGGSYTLTDTANVDITSATAATLTLSATDQLNINGLLNKDGTSSSGATSYNLAAAEDWIAGSPAATNVADLTGNGITVSNVATPTITSAVYDSDTGVLVVTGTHFVKKMGVTNDVDLSMFTFTGEGGAYTLSTTTDVEITSATSFTATLSGADKSGIDAKLDQIGTTSSGATTYNLAAAEDWMAGADAATNIADLTSNAITVSINPKITSATYNADTGSLVVTGSNIQAKAGGINDITANTITLTGEGGTTYTLTDTANVERTDASNFTLTLSATDKNALNLIMNKSGTTSTDGTTFNIAAGDDWNANLTAGDSSDTTGNAITVSNVAVPTLTSSAYDASTGVLVLTGTGFLSGAGATNDIIANLFTFTGEGAAAYTLTDTANVEITSGTSASLTLSSTDKLLLNGLLNKNGTASDGNTTYNLAVADNWLTGAATSIDTSDITNGVTVSNLATPTITSAAFDYATKVLAVTGTNFVAKPGADNDIDLTKLSLTGEAGTTHTLTGASVEVTSATSFSVTLSDSEALVISGLLNKDGTASDDATTYNLAAADNWLGNAAATTDISDVAGNAITVNNYALPVITSATYSTASGSLVVTGTNFVSKSGATNDVDISTLTLTGEAGATYTITSAVDIEVTSATEFSLVLTGADKTAVDVLLNKSGTSSSDVTTYNVGGADNWMIAAATSQDIADTSGNGVTVTVPTPAPTPTTPTTPSTSRTDTVDGVTVITETTTTPDGEVIETITIEPVVGTRVEDSNTQNSDLADVPLQYGNTDKSAVQTTASLPVGVGLVSVGDNTPSSASEALNELIALTNSAVSESDTGKGNILSGAQDFLDDIATGSDGLVVNSIVLTLADNVVEVPQAIVITGTANDQGSGVREALVIDASNLPSGTQLDLSNVEFAVIIGPATLRGGAGENIVYAGAGSQNIVLGADDDELYGGDGDDIIGSEGGDDLLFGNAGNDTMFGGEGADFLHGGADNDVITYSGNAADYTIVQNHSIITVSSLIDATDIDTLVNVETLQFSDGNQTISYDNELTQLATVYQQVFNRQADLDGIQWWAEDVMTQERNIGNIVVDILRSSEASSHYNVDINTASNTQLVSHLYTSLLGRVEDASGHAYWLDKMDNGTEFSDIATDFIVSVEFSGLSLGSLGWEFSV
jgi:hypothetical protein